MSDALTNVAFLAFAFMTALSAFLVVRFENLLHAGVALFFSLSGVAAIYVLLGADFVGVTQLIVYAGGILVLLIFGIFLTSRIYGAKVEMKKKNLPQLAGLGVAGALFGVIVWVVKSTEWPTKETVYSNTAASLGNLFLTKYVLAFELISLLLLLVMIGSVLLVHKEMGEGG